MTVAQFGISFFEIAPCLSDLRPLYAKFTAVL